MISSGILMTIQNGVCYMPYLGTLPNVEEI